MEKTLNKAALIRDLYSQGWDTPRIARVVFATDTPTMANLAYVRVVRQRGIGGISDTEINWRIRKHGSLKAYNKVMNDSMKDYRRAYYRKRYQQDPVYRGKVVARERSRRLGLREARITL